MIKADGVWRPQQLDDTKVALSPTGKDGTPTSHKSGGCCYWTVFYNSFSGAHFTQSLSQKGRLGPLLTETNIIKEEAIDNDVCCCY